jgi:hypothetical protein
MSDSYTAAWEVLMVAEMANEKMSFINHVVAQAVKTVKVEMTGYVMRLARARDECLVDRSSW